jgi:hypothetical protein
MLNMNMIIIAVIVNTVIYLAITFMDKLKNLKMERELKRVAHIVEIGGRIYAG